MKHQNKQHFSHHHILLPLQLEEGEKIDCKACEDLITEPFHGCLSCNVYLHNSCIEAPRSLDHPSHPTHPLTLLPTPTYPNRSFMCNACILEGNAFSYSCAHCEFDLHVQCACRPNVVLVENHPHELEMVFEFPHNDKSTPFACNLCSGIIDPDRWLYYCRVCDFGTHINCAVPKTCPANVGPGKYSRKNAEDSQERDLITDEENGEVMTFFEARKKLEEQRIAHQLLLESFANGVRILY